MVSQRYRRAFKEVLVVLFYVPKDDIMKIPKDVIDMLRRNQDREYVFNVSAKDLMDGRNIMQETKAILANLFLNYWATPEQKDMILTNERRSAHVNFFSDL